MSSKIPVAISFTGVANFLGVVGIIGSLMFVAMELQQNQKIALANAQQQRTNAILLNFDTYTASGLDWQSFMLENNLEYGYSKDLIARRNTYHSSWFLFENDYFQYMQGLMDEAVWQAKLRAFQDWYNRCDLRDLYVSRSRYMPAGFTAVIESFPDECAE